MWILELLTKGTCEIIVDIFNAMFSYILSFFSGDMVINVMNMNAIKTANTAITGIASIFIGILGAKRIITAYILETDGDSDMDPLQYLVKAALTLAVIQISTPLTKYLIKLSGLLCTQIGGTELYKYDSAAVITSLEKFSAIFTRNSTSVIFMMIMCIAILIILFRGVMRTIELAIMNILFPIFACDIMTAGRERWNAFLTHFLTTIFGYVIQILLINLSLRIYMDAEALNSMMLSAGCLFFAIKTPKWLDKFVYTTGIGQSAGRSAMYMVPQLIRLMK